MNEKALFHDYWKILNHFEDSVRGEFKEAEKEPPAMPRWMENPDPRIQGTEQAVQQEAPRKSSVSPRQDRCGNCGIALTRKNPIPGKGVSRPDLLVVVDPPDRETEESGEVLLPEHREFLRKWLEAIDLDLDAAVYITHSVKCRPPGGRDVFDDEITSCRFALDEEITLLAPKAVLALGDTAGWVVTGTHAPVAGLRKTPHNYRGLPAIVTFSPNQVLQNAQLKRPVWEDLKVLKALLTEGAETP